MELNVLEKTLEIEKRLLDTHKTAVEGQQKSMDWWFGFLSFAMAVIALLSGLIPYLIYRRAQKDLEQGREKITAQLAQTKQLCEQAEKYNQQAQEHLSAIENTRQQAEKHKDEIAAMKQVSFGTPKIQPNDENNTDNAAGIKAAEELKENTEIPLIERLRARAILLQDSAHDTTTYEQALTAWKAVLLEDENDVQANFGAGYCSYELSLNAADQRKEHLLTEARKYYEKTLAVAPDHYQAANNLGLTLNSEAQILSAADRLNEAQEKWRMAAERFRQVLDIKSDYYQAACNWGVALAREAQALSAAGRLNEAEEKWWMAAERFRQALDIKPDADEAARNWSAALIHEAQALSAAGRLNEAQEKRQQSIDLINSFIKNYPEYTAVLSYNLAFTYALGNQPEQAVQALETARLGGSLPDKARIEADKDFDAIRNTEVFQTWFKQAFPESGSQP
ncbi:hypothetical protein [Neisseria sp.]|uniref:TPR end-of-group domain-containing protein n=1 Tax=Neisseria sp. TaxID=192066 RepID=UPI00359F490B